MVLIDCLRWKPNSDRFVFACRYPESNLSTYAQLVVYESQEALLFSKGRLMGKFGPGKHTLDTENVPLLRKFFGIPFGGNNPFTAEVWIINKLYPANLLWQVNNMILHDVDYQTMLPLQAKGQYGVRVADAERFMLKMVGTKDVFTDHDMLSQAYGEFATKSKSAIVQFMTGHGVGFKNISAYLEDLSKYIKQQLLPFWREYGLEMTKFYVTEVALDTSTPEGRKVSGALASQASMSITGHSWQQEQIFDVANNAIEMIGAAGGGNSLIAGLMAMNVMGGLNSNGNNELLQTHVNQPSFARGQTAVAMGQSVIKPVNGIRMVYCASCSQKHLITERYCPHCGNEYRPCQVCGTDNLPGARRCVSCGASLQNTMEIKCHNCGAPLSSDTAFCPKCGTRQNISSEPNVCPQCGTKVSPNAAFCPKCGKKL